MTKPDGPGQIRLFDHWKHLRSLLHVDKKLGGVHYQASIGILQIVPDAVQPGRDVTSVMESRQSIGPVFDEIRVNKDAIRGWESEGGAVVD